MDKKNTFKAGVYDPSIPLDYNLKAWEEFRMKINSPGSEWVSRKIICTTTQYPPVREREQIQDCIRKEWESIETTQRPCQHARSVRTEQPKINLSMSSQLAAEGIATKSSMGDSLVPDSRVLQAESTAPAEGENSKAKEGTKASEEELEKRAATLLKAAQNLEITRKFGALDAYTRVARSFPKTKAAQTARERIINLGGKLPESTTEVPVAISSTKPTGHFPRPKTWNNGSPRFDYEPDSFGFYTYRPSPSPMGWLYKDGGGSVFTNGYYRSSGTFVHPYTHGAPRTSGPDFDGPSPRSFDQYASGPSPLLMGWPNYGGGGGSVSVNGYYRSSGTFVHPYTRRAPHY